MLEQHFKDDHSYGAEDQNESEDLLETTCRGCRMQFLSKDALIKHILNSTKCYLKGEGVEVLPNAPVKVSKCEVICPRIKYTRILCLRNF